VSARWLMSRGAGWMAVHRLLGRLSIPRLPMRPHVWFLALALACSSPPADRSGAPDPGPANALTSNCYTLQLGGTPSPDVVLPALIELSREPAPNFVEPGRLAVHEPGAVERRAPISWWVPRGTDQLELVLGGGYTGYTFAMKAEGRDWIGKGTYFADFGIEPTPSSLPARLKPRICP
jgi:hypothetical protein